MCIDRRYLISVSNTTLTKSTQLPVHLRERQNSSRDRADERAEHLRRGRRPGGPARVDPGGHPRGPAAGQEDVRRERAADGL